MQIIKSSYFDRFRCIAGKCPDSCCHEWEVQVDDESAALYRALPGTLGDRLRQVLKDDDGDTYMAIENGRCPMWRDDGLCRIQAELGENALCRTCRDFPRLTHDYGDFIEYGLELSCPEAARLILTSLPQPPVTEDVPGGESPSYDRQAMDILLKSRKEALALLDGRLAPGEALAALLIYGCHVQGLLDGAEETPFEPAAALETARKFGRKCASRPLLRFFEEQEILTDRWRSRLAAPCPGPWPECTPALARYGIGRYWLQAVADHDLVCRVKLIVVACLLVRLLGGDPIETAQLFSKEIENNIDNVEAILDAAYTHPAFTDDKLLWLLLE